jgi:PAS domain S-box-containing protein
VTGLTPVGAGILAATFGGGLLGGLLAVYAWRHREEPAARTFAQFMGALSVFAILTGLEMAAPTVELTRTLHHLGGGLSLGMVVLWFAFAVRYTGNGHLLTRRRMVLLWANTAGYTLLLLLRPYHGIGSLPEASTYQGLQLVAISWGPLSLLESVFAYLLVLAGFAFLVRFLMRSRTIYRKQTAAILVGSLAPLFANAFYMTSLTPNPGLDLTSVFFLLQGGFIAVALFRYDFLEVTPLAADLLIQEMDDPVVVLDDAGTVVDVNPAGRGLFDQADVEGRPLAALSEPLATAVETGDGTTVTARPPSGERLEQRTLDPNVTDIRDQHGRARGRLVVLRDITERKRREAELRRQNERLDEFASVVSHDLRSPLSVAYSYAELARESDDTEPLEDVLDALDDIDAMVDGLLSLARDGRAVDDPETVDLAEQVERAWMETKASEATLETTVERSIEADPQRLRRLLTNLFRNAVDHGPEDVTVRVGPLGDDVPGFYVADDGPGLPDDVDVFEQGVTTSEDGTGFGLAIVETIAEAHGWTVEATESEEGGARFEFRTPSHTTDGGERQPTSSDEAERRPESSSTDDQQWPSSASSDEGCRPASLSSDAG